MIMRNQQQVVSFPRGQQNQNKWNSKKLFFLGGIMLICFLLSVLGIYYLQYYYLAQELEEYNQQVDKLEVANRELEEEISRLQEDDYIEFLARRHLGLKRPGD